MALNVAATVTLWSYRNASLFWIMLWLVLGPADYGVILPGRSRFFRRVPHPGVCRFGRLESRGMIYSQAEVERSELSPGSVLARPVLMPNCAGPPAATIGKAE